MFYQNFVNKTVLDWHKRQTIKRCNIDTKHQVINFLNTVHNRVKPPPPGTRRYTSELKSRILQLARRLYDLDERDKSAQIAQLLANSTPDSVASIRDNKRGTLSSFFWICQENEGLDQWLALHNKCNSS